MWEALEGLDSNMRYAGFVFVLLWALSAAALADEVVHIDLASDMGPVTYRASGFLHAMSATEPPAALVDPLKPRLFRMAAEDWQKVGAGAWACYERATKLGARMQVVVSDSHGYQLAGWWPGDNGDWTGWESIVERLVRHAQSAHCIVEWDIWNEPNLGYFWGRDRDRLFETWKRGFYAIRKLDPKAIIVGPSISGFDRAYMEAFLAYCKANDVVPDKISWHEMGSAKSIAKHCEQIRDISNSLGITRRPSCINEIIGSKQTCLPGPTVLFFAALERAAVDGACHACWGDEGGVSACENQSLDGILTPKDKKPRAAWWAYKAYARLAGRLVGVIPTDTADGVASVDVSSARAYALLGRSGGEKQAIRVNFANLGIRGKVRVKAERISDVGCRPLAAPLIIIDEVREAEANKLSVVLPGLGPYDACSISLAPVAPTTR